MSFTDSSPPEPAFFDVRSGTKRTDGRTDGQDLLSRCKAPSKENVSYKMFQLFKTICRPCMKIEGQDNREKGWTGRGCTQKNKYREGTSEATTSSSLIVSSIIMSFDDFQKRPYSSFEHDMEQTDGRTDERRDGRTDGRTDG